MEMNNIVLRLSSAAGKIATFCDHVEHNEPADKVLIQVASKILMEITFDLYSDNSIPESYGQRLKTIEERNVLFQGLTLEEQANKAQSWRDLQLCQIAHDAQFHPDVVGMSKYDQLRHYAFHVAKLAGSYAEFILNDSKDNMDNRQADIIIFAIKLSTVINSRLSSEHVFNIYSYQQTTIR
jgi:hypothetical protein